MAAGVRRKITVHRMDMWGKRMLLAGAACLCLFLGGCAWRHGGSGEQVKADSPEAAMEATMGALKDLDMDAFNRLTDNYVCTYMNVFGIPKEKEYKVFSELLQPGGKVTKQYKRQLQFDRKLMENLEWTILEVREESGRAAIRIQVSNTDMSGVMDHYMIYVMENAVQSGGTGIGSIIHDITGILDEAEEGSLLHFMEEADGDYTETVTVKAYKEDGGWKIHLNDAFINAFSGNMMEGGDSEEVEERLEELEEEYERKWEQWGEGLEEKVEKWTDSFHD